MHIYKWCITKFLRNVRVEKYETKTRWNDEMEMFTVYIRQWRITKRLRNVRVEKRDVEIEEDERIWENDEPKRTKEDMQYRKETL